MSGVKYFAYMHRNQLIIPNFIMTYQSILCDHKNWDK